MKKLLKQFFKESLVLCVFLYSATALFAPQAEAFSGKRNFCTKVPNSFGKKLARKFQQDPLQFLEQFLQASSDEMSSLGSQNQIVSASFDLNRLYKANTRIFKSEVITNSLFDWVRTQYFGNLNSNYLDQNHSLLKKNYDLLTSSERFNMKNFKPQWTAIKKVNCTRREASLLGCTKGMLKMTIQFLPEITCKRKALKKAFEADFFLTYSSRLGFKILDIRLSGKRLVLDSLDMMLSLKKEGFNKTAITRHLGVLSLGKTSFKMPKKQVHSGRFLANFKQRLNQERVPASL